MLHVKPGIGPGSITKSPNSYGIFNWMKLYLTDSEHWEEDPSSGDPLWSIYTIYTVFSIHEAVVYLSPLVLHFLSSQWINLHLDSKQFSVDDLCPGKAISILSNRKSFPGMPECLMSLSVVERYNISKSKQKCRCIKYTRISLVTFMCSVSVIFSHLQQ